MNKSKKELVAQMVERAVKDAVMSTAFDFPEQRNSLAITKCRLEHEIMRRIVWDDYRWLELQDIMAWRKRAIKD